MTPDEKELSRFHAAENIGEEQNRLVRCFRDAFEEFAADILKYVPACADRSAAIRYLRLAHMQVNAAICHDWPEEKNDNK